MNKEGAFPILSLLVRALIFGYFGLEVHRRKKKLRSIYNVIEKGESTLAEILEQMVETGELKPSVN
jgi:hypothetical protein